MRHAGVDATVDGVSIGGVDIRANKVLVRTDPGVVSIDDISTKLADAIKSAGSPISVERLSQPGVVHGRRG
jgi:hypothetical protein